MTRVAAIDVGTNSVRLLIADVDGNALTDIARQMEITRLGRGVDRTGRFAPDALQRTVDVLQSYAQQCRKSQVERSRVVATSATRDAANRHEFVAAVVARFGTKPDVVTGREEA